MHISDTRSPALQLNPICNMKTALVLGVSLLGMVSSAAAAGAFDGLDSRITTTMAIRIAAVSESNDAPGWYTVQQIFANSFADSLKLPGRPAMPVQVNSTEAELVGDALLAGEYDAVLVLGERLPASLRGAKFASVRAVSQIGIPVKVFHLVVSNREASSRAVLHGAFESVTSSISFQEAVGRASATRVVADARR
jgi:hypothetical protein